MVLKSAVLKLNKFYVNVLCSAGSMSLSHSVYVFDARQSKTRRGKGKTEEGRKKKKKKLKDFFVFFLLMFLLCSRMHTAARKPFSNVLKFIVDFMHAMISEM
jgi:hypothetical protein